MKIEKVEKFLANWYDKREYVIHIRNLKQAFNQKTRLKPYSDINKEVIKNAKNDFERDFFKLMNDAVFGKTIKNVRKHRNIKLAATEA